MLTVVVMPCLNEVDQVEKAVASILYRQGAEPRDTHLVIVDNGSTDGTLPVLDRLRRRDPRHVHVRFEPKRGYVPPRHHGVAAAARIGAAAGVAAEQTLILQADSDTEYRVGYVSAMVEAAGDRAGMMLEGATRRPAAFEADHPKFVEAERLVDAALEHLEVPDELDVVVDDKVCGYRLSDYIKWGGLFEEQTPSGDSIHAETTRLFIRARLLHGAIKVRVNPAGAIPSRRRLLDETRLQFATIGFPREKSWSAARPNLLEPVDVDVFALAILRGDEREAAWLRSAHLVSLFRFLPALVMRTETPEAPLFGAADVAAMLDREPRRTREEVAARPGIAIADAFRLIDQRPELFPLR